LFLDSPDHPSQSQVDFLSNRVNLVCGNTYVDGCYGNVVDECSFFDEYLFQTIDANQDAYTNNAYFFTDKHKLISAGPVWDMDHSYWLSRAKTWDDDWKSDNNFMWNQLSKDKSFKIRLYRRYKQLRQSVLSLNNTYTLMNLAAPTIAKDLAKENFNQTLDQYVAEVKQYLKLRFDFLDQNFLNYLGIKANDQPRNVTTCPPIIFPKNGKPENSKCPSVNLGINLYLN